MGVTTVITGNCGSSSKDIGTLLRGIDAWGGHVNVATLVGHNTIRESVMGTSRRKPTAEELEKMISMVDRAMREGALGLSTGLEYSPGAFAGEEEVVALAEVAARWGGIYATHMRDEGRYFTESLEEALRTAKAANVRLQLSHLKIASPAKWGEMASALKRIDAARKAGQQITEDLYVYNASSTSSDLLLPVEYRGTASIARTVLRDPERRKDLAMGMLRQLKEEGFSDYRFARVAYFKNQALNGKTIPEITEILPRIDMARSWHQPWLVSLVRNPELRRQLETVLYLYFHGGAQMIYFVISEKDIEAVLSDPNSMIGSDSAVRSREQVYAHPRGSGNFARVLSKYVRERKILSLSDALRRMTSLPAETFGIGGRGRLIEGYAADIVIFDPDKIEDRAWYDHPLDPPAGIDCVIVNGEIVVRNGEVREIFPGRAIRLKRRMTPLELTPRQSWSRIATASEPAPKVAAKRGREQKVVPPTRRHRKKSGVQSSTHGHLRSR
jgi:N-acyl-D-amino-acid deacylase